MKNTKFSLIEMLAVIVVILVIATLLMPMMNNLRAKARTVICANNLKQVGHMISLYALDNNDYLPRSGDKSYKDLKDGSEYYAFGKNVKRRYAYDNWAGHLLPYFPGLDLKDFSRGRGGEKIVYSASKQAMTMPAKSKANPAYGNYLMFEQMVNNGGYGPLKILICPTAANTLDAHALPSDKEIPRIAGITNRYGLGMVSSYIGNGLPMGNRSSNSKRYQDLNKQSILVGEGGDYGEVGKQYMPGLCFNAGAGGNAYSSAGTFNMANAYVGSNYLRGNNVAFSFLHDDTTEIWVSYKSRGASYAFVSSFNKAYFPNAAASYDYGAPEHKKFSLASNIYPGEEWLNFSDILTRYKIPRILVAKFHQEDTRFGYGFGEMNILTADFSVKKRHLGWMYENWRELSYYGTE